MKNYQVLSIALLISLQGCSGGKKQGFKGDVVKQNVPQSQNAEPEEDVDQGDEQAEPLPEPELSDEPTAVPGDQIFVGCKKGSASFPILADVYQLPPQTEKLPDFSEMTKSDIVCLDKFDIKPQSWDIGFPGATNLQEWFGLRAQAMITIPKAGSYVFKLLSDDGSILSIDGSIVVNHDGQHSPTEKIGQPIELTLGQHEINLDYFQGPRTMVALQLFWKVPGSDSFTIVPSSAFSEK